MTSKRSRPLTTTRRAFAGGLAAASLIGSGPGRASAVDKIPDVIVLGAGISGLNAAWLLEQQGLKVTVLEARNRVGGRIVTLSDLPGYPEMGFNSMGAGYGRGIEAARRAGVELWDLSARAKLSGDLSMFVDGKSYTRETWRTADANPLAESLRAMMPYELVGRLIAQKTQLKDWTQWLDPSNAALDIPLRDFLLQNGVSSEAIALAYDAAPYYGVSSRDISALMLQFNDGFIKTQIAYGPQSFAVKGGNSKLPTAMAGQLKGPVHLNKVVKAIDEDKTGVTIRCADGSRFRAKRVLVSLPFSTLRHIAIHPGLSDRQAQAVATLPYQPLSIAYLSATGKFWEQDGLSPSMWTNGSLGTVISQRFGDTDTEVTGLMVLARGALALAWDSKGRDGALAMIVSELERLRPAAKGKVKALSYFSWSHEPFNLGDWAYFHPGQIAGFAAVMAAPRGRLHFCGEHTAQANRGLEAALESSERAAVEILSA
jgi:monoamine oxidase